MLGVDVHRVFYRFEGQTFYEVLAFLFPRALLYKFQQGLHKDQKPFITPYYTPFLPSDSAPKDSYPQLYETLLLARKG